MDAEHDMDIGECWVADRWVETNISSTETKHNEVGKSIVVRQWGTSGVVVDIVRQHDCQSNHSERFPHAFRFFCLHQYTVLAW